MLEKLFPYVLRSRLTSSASRVQKHVLSFIEGFNVSRQELKGSDGRKRRSSLLLADLRTARLHVTTNQGGAICV